MQTYNAPLRDMRFVLHELHGLDALTSLPYFADLNAETVDLVLEEASRIATEVLLPLNASGDAEGCIVENGVVRTPKGFREAYDVFRDGGWNALAGDPDYGGQGLPESVNKLVEEMICAANLSFGLYPGLTHGAVMALSAYGSSELKDLYLPKMIDGIWSGAMCLTESQCGTDLGLLRTRAVPQEDGSYLLTGSKIFISAGEHDLTENIIHLVLARLPDAPPGIKGISLFLAPKFLPKPDGSVGPRNGILCTGLEHKMGLKASATCQISFDDAQAWLVGAPHKGMQSMFVMMNEERLGVGIQGLGVASAAYQSAVSYAKDRLQGRSLSGTKRPDLAADPIIVHPDVRRMLMTMRTTAEGCRAVGIWVAQAVDLSKHANTEGERKEAADFVALMTPVVKALFTDLGFEAASLGVQVYGGHGYIREHGVEQYVRDARIAMLYEGTNGIQALDLVGRKMPAHMGRYLRRLFHPISNFIEAHRKHEAVAGMVEQLERAFGALQLATGQIAQAGLKDPEEAGAAATDYLRLLGLVAMGYMFVRSAVIASERLAGNTDEPEFYRAKLASARFFIDRTLPQATALFLAIKSGKASMMALEEAAF
ncbi:acyl-CoA dehydrogenase [Lichenicola cladoniae]|uniref:3-methylmercaptopropionyl-CoA dehydrogenase n=1 Tax=Lichenicola cladoniae TaxID=1484109 RepID=A0A6M8HW39_9PROT|nr:acyl-CoA dehydrogenase C-terminal domain-containing protein [Lichenicola cladoniae]NPD66675.1 acyl-CoA dehydrogenase [Acetobacteraceae bacterium]QKE92301.1 acyl-CoA dehydrogenase [Lichenicola cladoniae]